MRTSFSFLHRTAVAASFTTPANHRSIVQDGGECILQNLEFLHVLQLVSHGTAIATLLLVAPGHDRAVATDGRKGKLIGLDVLHVLQLHRTAVAAPQAMAPGHERGIAKERCKRDPGGLNHAHVLQLLAQNCSCRQLHPPQLTTDPSSRMAANAFSKTWNFFTFFSWSRTELQSPPLSAMPQVSTEPSPRMAAMHARP